MSKLKDYQYKHYETLLWLLDPHSNCGTGRTEVLTHAYTNLLIKYKHTAFTIHDHHIGFRSDKMLVQRICHRLTSLGYDFKLNWNIKDNKITVTGKIPQQ